MSVFVFGALYLQDVLGMTPLMAAGLALLPTVAPQPFAALLQPLLQKPLQMIMLCERLDSGGRNCGGWGLEKRNLNFPSRTFDTRKQHSISDTARKLLRSRQWASYGRRFFFHPS